MGGDTVSPHLAHLRAQLDAVSAELAECNAKLRDEMFARDAAEEQLRVAHRRRDEFLATLAHELRNPLAPIRYSLSVLNALEADEANRRWSSEVITRQVDRLALLLDDLLDVSRLTQGRLTLKIAPIELGTVISAAIETATPLIETKQLHFTLEGLTQSMTVAVDALRLSQALVNLLTNAANFTEPGGRITLRVRVGPDDLEITVEDTGIGIEVSAIPDLFNLFTRVTPTGHRGEGGLGIGLALVRGLMELHGGTVEAASAGLTRGAQFTIRLPHSIIVNREVPRENIPAARAAPGVPRGKVLIIDDNRDSADSLALLLKYEGYEVTVGYTGQQALELGAYQLPDALIMDIGLPDILGYDVARSVRQQPWGKALLLLAMTGWGQATDKERALQAGFNRHLTKPIDPGKLEQLLADWMRTRAPGIDHPIATQPEPVSPIETVLVPASAGPRAELVHNSLSRSGDR